MVNDRLSMKGFSINSDKVCMGQTFLNTNIAQAMQIASGHQSQVLTRNIHAMNINALPSREMNNLSPRVVSMANIPLRGLPPGS